MSDLQSLSTKSFAENCLVGGDEGLKKSIRLSRKTPLLGVVCVCRPLSPDSDCCHDWPGNNDLLSGCYARARAHTLARVFI